MKKTVITLIAAIAFSCVMTMAQEKGYVSASLESTNHFYVEDEANNFIPSYQPQLGEDGFYASNNYLKVDYYNGRFSAGTQLEGYFPYLVGYPKNLKKMSLSNLYATWRDNSYSITIGSFYDQFGSGLLFRSWEDRTLGLNNAIVGIRATYNFNDYVSLKVLWGVPRLGTGNDNGKFFGLGLTDVKVAGADLSISLSDMFNMETTSLSVEGSILNKHEALKEEYLIERGYSPDIFGWSGRVNLDHDGFFAKGEYVDAGKQMVNSFNPPVKGNAQLIELGYNGRGLGVTMTGRRMKHMTQRLCTYSMMGTDNPVNNMLSYRPAMSTQYTYMLTTLNPYSPEIGDKINRSGEIGGQIDAFYNFRRGTKIGGKRGMKVHANFATYYSLKGADDSASDLLFRDFSFDIEKQWTKEFKSTLLYSMQNYNKKHENNGVYIGLSHIVVADLLYKFSSKFSTRMELQYLASKDDQKDWMAGLIEVNFAPHWSVFASDMYNHGESKLHYYNGGVSFAMNHLRVAAGYGRYRAGFICSGGVCREIPAYTGANLTLTASF